MLPQPSPEQAHALDVWRSGSNQVCSAAAGSSKSTMLLHACAASDVPVLVLTYNKQLQLEVEARLEAAGLPVAHQVRTFHGLCSQHLAPTPDDESMHAALLAAVEPVAPLRVMRVCIDEAQDLKRVYHSLLRALLGDLSSVQWLLVGDAVQMLNDYDPDDPALLTFMQEPEQHFGGARPWCHTSLTVSFRLPPSIAEVVNAVREDDGRLEGGARGEAAPVRFITCSNWRWAEVLLPWITHLRAAAPEFRVCLLVARRRGNPPLRALVNALARRGVPVHINGLDVADARACVGNPVLVSTWHASKGTKCDAAALLGVDARSAHNPLHVALTRSRTHLLVLLNRDSMHPGLMRAVDPGSAHASLDITCDAATRRFAACPPPGGWVAAAQVAPAAAAEGVAAPAEREMRDITHWYPRGRATRLQDAIADGAVVSVPVLHPPPDRQVVNEGRWLDTAPHYQRAVLMKLEREASGTCRFLEFMQAPARATRQACDEAILAGSHAYSLRPHVKDADLLPTAAAEALREVCARGPSTAADWVTLATCADAFDGFHHNLCGLLPCAAWVDDDVFDAAYDCLVAHLGPVLEAASPKAAAPEAAAPEAAAPEAAAPEADYNACSKLDVCLTAAIGNLTLASRCFCALPGTVWFIASGDGITRCHRLHACMLLALHPTATSAVVLNLRTGEAQAFSLHCKAQFRLELAASVCS